MRSLKEIASATDHTLLKPEATREEIIALCNEALAFSMASVCIPPALVRVAADYLGDRLPVCTVIGFPLGYHTTESKLQEARQALFDGASELDMVINIGWAKEGNFAAIEQEIAALKKVCGSKVLKVIVETCLLSDAEKIALCRAVTDAGADYIKTSTGFSKYGATREDVKLLAEHVGEGVLVKAAGGISTLEDASDFLELGASRLGSSRLANLLRAAKASE
ncbi:MAG: deoxyribose-phosphate aldolase [Oscillospiraceae bacterium]|nr:deoxyribose-phosphate aldolase [Oscillospiraceae bacterium]